VAFKIPYIYDFVTKLCRQRQKQKSQNHENVNVHNIGQGKTQCIKYKRHILGRSQAYDHSSV
jgi:hypothetical protein